MKLAERIERVEKGFHPILLDRNELPFELSIQKLMQMYRVPGLSVAVIDNFEIVWAKGYGVAEAGTITSVATNTLFQAGSISKPVAAVGALRLVEQGKLSLDEDVNKRLVSWKVPENRFTKDEKVTLRRILCHSAGLTVHGFNGYDRDESIPTLLQILNGAPPANNLPIRVDSVPGARWRYSGGGTMIAQQLMMDVTGRPFPQLVHDFVLSKIGMDHSTFEQPLPESWTAETASGTLADGKVVHGKWHVYPEMAAAGLWTTPSDLARFAIEIALSKLGRSNRLLSEIMTREMLKPQVEHLEELALDLGNAEHPDRMGLGFFLGDETRQDLFGHIGTDAGFQAMLIMYGNSGKGAALMANSQVGMLVEDYLVQSIAREYEWDYVPPRRTHPEALTTLFLLAQRKGVAAAIEKHGEFRRTGSVLSVAGENTLVFLAYLLVFEQKLQDAIKIMKYAIKEYPKYWNAYDTLGEIYLHSGDKVHAIENYEKSLELNPDNQNGKVMLKKLKQRD
jgi:CubicO group peptidase (beta-lactamase class C family)